MSANVQTDFIEVIKLSTALFIRRGNKSFLAKELGISRNTLSKHIEDGDDKLLLVLRDGASISSFELINK